MVVDINNMVVDISHDLKNILNSMMASHAALELTKVVVAQENDAGKRILDDQIGEIYNKILNNNQNIYTYIDSLINDYTKIMNYINKFHHQKVIILGYYNVLGTKDDIFDYANYKLEIECQKREFIYVDLSKILSNNPNYFSKKDTFVPNLEGYEKISQIIVEKIQNN